jgi:hypothetical protein
MGERRRRASATGGGVRAEEEKAAAPPTVWFSLKKSLHCRSAPSEVHVPRPKSVAAPSGGHLSSIVTKRATARSGCSRSIANLRDVIHGSKRHPGQPPSCNSPRSIGSSEFLNPIAHEVVLSTSDARCELKITGFGGAAAAPHDSDADAGGVAASFVGTLRPGTPGPAWAAGLQYSGSCRGGRCTPPRSPIELQERNGSSVAVSSHRASCEETSTAKSGVVNSKGSGGLGCHRCGEQFIKWEALEAHHLCKHAGLKSLIVHRQSFTLSVPVCGSLDARPLTFCGRWAVAHFSSFHLYFFP